MFPCFTKNSQLITRKKTINPNGTNKSHLYFEKVKNTNMSKEIMKNMPDKQKIGKNYEPDKVLAKQIIYFAREQRNRLHPTQKPVSLLEYLIRTYTNAGETVLDFTMGSGSTGVACVNTNRHFIGIELDENYFNVAKQRIEDVENGRMCIL